MAEMRRGSLVVDTWSVAGYDRAMANVAMADVKQSETSGSFEKTTQLLLCNISPVLCKSFLQIQV